jgi:hypothetical protein
MRLLLLHTERKEITELDHAAVAVLTDRNHAHPSSGGCVLACEDCGTNHYQNCLEVMSTLCWLSSSPSSPDADARG